MLTEKRLILDWTKAHDVCPLEKKLADMQNQIWHAKNELLERKGFSPEYTGWIDCADQVTDELYDSIDRQVSDIFCHSDAVVVIGIGGSLLGTKAVYSALTHSFAQLNPDLFHRRPLLFWAGHHLALDELVELIDALDNYSPSLLVVSKSGTTTEPAVVFRILKNYLNNRYGINEADARVFIVTDPVSGQLHNIGVEKNYPMFAIPKDVGGRYSVFTPVGLFPLAIAGVPIKEMIAGVRAARDDIISEKNNSFETNPALCYAAIRNILYKENYKIESLCTWTPKLRSLVDWWVQLFAESDAKNGTGIFPVSAQFTTDLHSVGQYFQQGERHLFATHLKIMDEYSLSSSGSVKRKIKIPDALLNDGFDFLQGKDLSFVQNEAQLGTFLAHSDGQVPTLIWEIPELNAWWLGYWMYTNMFACAVGDYARGIDPFNQPGVEDYKQNMLALIGKPGFQQKAVQIKNRIHATQRLRALGMTCLKS